LSKSGGSEVKLVVQSVRVSGDGLLSIAMDTAFGLEVLKWMKRLWADVWQ
jgi:hypothetical protein